MAKIICYGEEARKALEKGVNQLADTDFRVYSGPDAAQHPAGRVGTPPDIASMVLYLCSEKAGFITGENICIDGGMT